MTSEYIFRMLCLSLAVFFLMNLAAGFAVVRLFGPVVRRISRWRAETAARFTFALRLLPVACALFFVAVYCVPSYLRFEPLTAEEPIGLLCGTAAACGLWVLGASLHRTLRACLHSSRLVKECRRVGRASRGSSPVLIVDDPTRLLAVMGLARPQIVISGPVARILSTSQLASALRHERAHLNSRDNWKRLALILAPGLLPGRHGFERLDASWRRFAEWSADDQACEGRPARSLALAGALVRMARLSASARSSALATPLLDAQEELPARVERLLKNAPVAPLCTRRQRIWIAAGTVTVLGLAVVLGASSQEAVHELLEMLVG